MDGELEAVLVLVEQAFDLEEVILLEGVEGLLDVVPHLGFDLATAIAEGQREIGFAGLLGFHLVGHDNKRGGNDLVFVLDAIGDEKIFHELGRRLRTVRSLN